MRNFNEPNTLKIQCTFDLLESPRAVDIVKSITSSIKSIVVGDRAHPSTADRNINEAGAAAELATIYMLTQDDNHFKHVIKKWIASSSSGPNCGRDIKASWLNSNKNIEVKSTPHFTYHENTKQSILYMRTMNGDATVGAPRKPKSYWEEKLPDSYYILMKQTDRNNEYKFKAIGWADKPLLLRYYSNEKDVNPNSRVFEETLSKKAYGYPTICIGSKYLYPMDDLLRVMYI